MDKHNKGHTKLTDKQERFVQELIKGNSQREAYKIAYDAENMKDNTIDRKAYEIANKDYVKARIDELRGKIVAKAEEKAIFTVESILNDIKELIERNKEKDDRVALEGLKTAAKHLGMFVDKVEHSGEIKMPTITIGK